MWQQLPFCSCQSIQTQVSGAHAGPRQPSGISPFRQRTRKSSSLVDSVCKLKVSNFPPKAHSPEMTKWGKRLPSSLTTEPHMHPTAFEQHEEWGWAREPALPRGREHWCTCKAQKAGVSLSGNASLQLGHSKAPAEHPRPRAGSAPTWPWEPPGLPGGCSVSEQRFPAISLVRPSAQIRAGFFQTGNSLGIRDACSLRKGDGPPGPQNTGKSGHETPCGGVSTCSRCCSPGATLLECEAAGDPGLCWTLRGI